MIGHETRAGLISQWKFLIKVRKCNLSEWVSLFEKGSIVICLRLVALSNWSTPYGLFQCARTCNIIMASSVRINCLSFPGRCGWEMSLLSNVQHTLNWTETTIYKKLLNTLFLTKLHHYYYSMNRNKRDSRGIWLIWSWPYLQAQPRAICSTGTLFYSSE